MKKERKSIKARPAPALRVYTPRIVIDANREILIEGCKEILSYDEESVRIKAKKMDVKISGRELTLNLLNGENLLLSGEIFGVEYLNLR